MNDREKDKYTRVRKIDVLKEILEKYEAFYESFEVHKEARTLEDLDLTSLRQIYILFRVNNALLSAKEFTFLGFHLNDIIVRCESMFTADEEFPLSILQSHVSELRDYVNTIKRR